ncbi:transcription termination factor 1-like [Festucalex cinctus]
MMKKKGTEDDCSFLPADVLAHKQKENTEPEDEDSLLLPAEGHAHKPKKKRSSEESGLLPADKHTLKKKERGGGDEGNRSPADVPASKLKQKKRIRDGKVAPAVSLSDREKVDKNAEEKMEEESVLLPATGCTKKEAIEEADGVFPADQRSQKKWKRPEEKDNGVLPDDKQRTKKKKRPEENTLSADEATNKKKKKKKEKGHKEQENVLVADGCTKKKKKVVEEEEVDSILPLGIQVKKKKRRMEDGVTMATVPTENKKRSTGTSVVAVAAEIDHEAEESVAVATTPDGATAEAVETRTASHDEPLDSLLVAELEEFIPNVRKRSADEIRKHLRYDLDRFRLFKQQGLRIRSGRFTQEENRRLRDNLAHFLAVTGIASAEQLLFPQRYSDLEADIKKLKRQHHFMEAIAEGIPRPCKVVLIRAFKLDHMNHMGQFSDEEVAQLVKLQKLHGNDWKSIAKKMGRSKYALQKRFAHIASGQGIWTAEEEDRLKEAVKAHLEAVSLQSSTACEDGLLNLQQLCARLPWTDISQHVRTRSWTQCRIKWFTILKCRLSKKSSRKGWKSLKTRLDLINTLYGMNVEDAGDVDWETVAASVGGVTSLHSQQIFRRLKVCNVPNWTRLSYGEIIDFLQERVAPRLAERLQRCDEHAKEEAEQVVAKAAYALLDIFAPGEDGDLLEMDNTGPGRRRWQRVPLSPPTPEEVHLPADDAQPDSQWEALATDGDN